MCSHYEAPTSGQLAAAFGVQVEQGILDLWPGYIGPYLRRQASVEEEETDEGLELEMLTGSFGLIPHCSKDTKICRRTFNARSETVADKLPYRNAWRRAQHCILGHAPRPIWTRSCPPQTVDQAFYLQ